MAEPPNNLVDVIIIGAGLSGLRSAVTLHESGASVLVLEARDRVGGKTWSRDFAGGVSDMGAAWINDTNQSRMFALAKKFELELIEQNTDGDIVMHDLDGSVHSFAYGGIPLKEVEPNGVTNMIRIRDLFETTCHKVDIFNLSSTAQGLGIDYDKMSMKEFVSHHSGGETALATVSIWTRAMLGLEPEEVSALWFLGYCKAGGGIMNMRSDRKDGGQFLRIAKGTQSFSRGLASLLPPDIIQFSTKMTSITDTGSSVQVSTSTGTKFTARKLIISLPSTLYNTISFTPPLPPSTQKLANSTVHGHTSKVFLSFSHPFWKDIGSCGLTQSLRGLTAVTRDTSNPSLNHWSLLCFLVGEPARKWAKLPVAERRDAVVKHIKEVFEPLMTEKGLEVPQPTGYIEQIWSNEEFSAGCPCPAFPPGLLTELAEVTGSTEPGGESGRKEDRPWSPYGNVHFVGTETADVWRGYMEGAVRSGERGAAEVLSALNT